MTGLFGATRVNTKLTGVIDMRAITKLLAASAVAITMAAAAAPANAITYILPWTNNLDQSIGLNFGDDKVGDATGPGVYYGGADAQDGTSSHVYNSGTGAFTDTFNFTLPSGIVGFSGISIGFNALSSLHFTSVKFNGADLSLTNQVVGTNGNISSYFTLAALPVQINGPQTLVIEGVGGANSQYDGSGTFMPVPEPGTWALMIIGFGGAGAMIRSRRRDLVKA